MYPTITIEGSLTPCTVLKKGERRTVALTDRIQRLIDRGYVTVIDAPPGAFTDDPIHYAKDSEAEEASWEPGDPILDPPSRGASRESWSVWLDAHNIAHDDAATRADLIGLWDAAQASG